MLAVVRPRGRVLPRDELGGARGEAHNHRMHAELPSAVFVYPMLHLRQPGDAGTLFGSIELFTFHFAGSWMRDAIPYLVAFGIALVCVLLIPKRGTSPVEESPKTYDSFVDANGTQYFDPVGASSILSRITQFRDGYECFWNFKISEPDFDKLANLIAVNNNGPVELKWHLPSSPPVHWKPQEPFPEWWQLPKTATIDPKSTHWCFDYIDDGRHKGWFLAFDRIGLTALIWHWNHQWSNHEWDETGMAK